MLQRIMHSTAGNAVSDCLSSAAMLDATGHVSSSQDEGSGRCCGNRQWKPSQLTAALVMLFLVIL